MRLDVDPDELAMCVSCGLCLPHCPTYRVTGEETASPRGRIAAMRLVEAGAEADADFVRFMDTCVQCRGCEAACPSGVPFGRLMEGTRHSLVAAGRYQPRWRRWGLALLGRGRLLRAASVALGLAQRARLVPPRLGLPVVPLRNRPLRASGGDAVLFTGCVMDAWTRPVHQAVQRVMEATGAGVTPSGPAAGCCGALAGHAGLTDLATRQARRVVRSLPPGAPVVVDSAGCGAWMRDYGRLLGAEGADFAARVVDVHTWLEPRPLPPAPPLAVRAAVQDPCHLRHVQKAHGAVRSVLGPYVAELVDIPDDGMCCGAGGSYSLWQPELADGIRRRKLAAVATTGASVVVSANPGCSLHLAAAGITVAHPLELVDRALAGGATDRAGPDREGSVG